MKIKIKNRDVARSMARSKTFDKEMCTRKKMRNEREPEKNQQT